MSLEERKYFYTKTEYDGNIEFDYLKNKLINLNLSTIDKYKITAATANRPDLISNIYYGSYNFGWLIHYHNDNLNPFTDYTIGTVVNIPSLDDYYRFYNRNARKV
jgi:hypothetical protein